MSWIESGTFWDAPDDDLQVPTSMYVEHRCAPSRIHQEVHPGDKCPYCEKGVLIAKVEKISMPKAWFEDSPGHWIEYHDATSELQCDTCHAAYWREKNDSTNSHGRTSETTD